MMEFLVFKGFGWELFLGAIWRNYLENREQGVIWRSFLRGSRLESFALIFCRGSAEPPRRPRAAHRCFGKYYKLSGLFFIMGNILVKVHESYRWVVAVCDEDIFGRKLVEGNRVLDVSGIFFEGEKMSETEAVEEIVRCNREDATFNFVGVESVGIAKKLGLVKDEGVVMIEGVPFALVLL